jgi:predicted anti-sigma-YlaC factor YlaD
VLKLETVYGSGYGQKQSHLLAGNIASLLAAIIIAYLLITVYYNGYQILFTAPYAYFMALLVVIGVLARHSYLKVATSASEALRRIAPLVISLAAIGVVTGLFNSLLGGALIVVSYILEFFIALPLARDLASVSSIASRLFISGIIVFSASLPFIVFTSIAAVTALIGDAIKTLGLALLIIKSLAGSHY